MQAIPKVTQYTLGDGQYETQHRLARSEPRAVAHVSTRGRLPRHGPSDPAGGARRASSRTRSPACARSRRASGRPGCSRRCRARRTTASTRTNGATYTTPPLTQDLRLSGPLFADLWVTTTARGRRRQRPGDGRRSGRDLDRADRGWLAGSFRAVDPTRSRYVGGQLLQPWHPFTKDSTLVVSPGVPIELPVEIFPTNAVIKAGHSLRIAVGPNDFPHAVPPALQLASSLGGVVQVLHDPQHPSYVALPDARDVPEELQAAPGRESDPRLSPSRRPRRLTRIAAP